jgi:hypothetical protein
MNEGDHSWQVCKLHKTDLAMWGNHQPFVVTGCHWLSGQHHSGAEASRLGVPPSRIAGCDLRMGGAPGRRKYKKKLNCPKDILYPKSDNAQNWFEAKIFVQKK